MRFGLAARAICAKRSGKATRWPARQRQDALRAQSRRWTARSRPGPAERAAEHAAAERSAREQVRRAAAAKRLAAEVEKRAELFVASWKKESVQARKAPTYAARDEARANLNDMAKSLHRDPQLESLLQNRRAQLGLDAVRGKTLPHDLQQYFGRGRGMGISM